MSRLEKIRHLVDARAERDIPCLLLHGEKVDQWCSACLLADVLRAVPVEAPDPRGMPGVAHQGGEEML